MKWGSPQGPAGFLSGLQSKSHPPVGEGAVLGRSGHSFLPSYSPDTFPATWGSEHEPVLAHVVPAAFSEGETRVRSSKEMLLTAGMRTARSHLSCRAPHRDSWKPPATFRPPKSQNFVNWTTDPLGHAQLCKSTSVVATKKVHEPLQSHGRQPVCPHGGTGAPG